MLGSSSRNRDRRHNLSFYVSISHRFGNFMGTSGAVAKQANSGKCVERKDRQKLQAPLRNEARGGGGDKWQNAQCKFSFATPFSAFLVA